jgi:hypothetical protein
MVFPLLQLDLFIKAPQFPVNPGAEDILGLRAYPSVTAVGSDIELAIMVTPAKTALAVLDECAAKGSSPSSSSRLDSRRAGQRAPCSRRSPPERQRRGAYASSAPTASASSTPIPT